MSASAKTNPWAREFAPPRELDTDRIHLEPIKPEHGEIDYVAVYDSYPLIESTQRFRQFYQDEQYTIDQNTKALKRHWDEFNERKAYAYTVLDPTNHKLCVGCCYYIPAPKEPHHPDIAELTYWVTRQGLKTDLDLHLLVTLLDWTLRDWPFQRLILPYYETNNRCINHAEKSGLKRLHTTDEKGRIIFEWNKDEH